MKLAIVAIATSSYRLCLGLCLVVVLGTGCTARIMSGDATVADVPVNSSEYNALYYRYSATFDGGAAGIAGRMYLPDLCLTGSIALDESVQTFGKAYFRCSGASGDTDELEVPIFGFQYSRGGSGTECGAIEPHLSAGISPYIVYKQGYICELRPVFGTVQKIQLNGRYIVDFVNAALNTIGGNKLTAAALSTAYDGASGPASILISRMLDFSIADDGRSALYSTQNSTHTLGRLSIPLKLREHNGTEHYVGSIVIRRESRASLFTDSKMVDQIHPDFTLGHTFPLLMARTDLPAGVGREERSLSTYLADRKSTLSGYRDRNEFSSELSRVRTTLQQFPLNRYDFAYSLYYVASGNDNFRTSVDYSRCSAMTDGTVIDDLRACGIQYPGSECLNAPAVMQGLGDNRLTECVDRLYGLLQGSSSYRIIDANVLSDNLEYADDNGGGCRRREDVANLLAPFNVTRECYVGESDPQSGYSGSLLLKKRTGEYYVSKFAVDRRGMYTRLSFFPASEEEVNSRHARCPSWQGRQSSLAAGGGN